MAAFVVGIVAAGVNVNAQRHSPPHPPPPVSVPPISAPTVTSFPSPPVSLTVPHPIPPIRTSPPRDLYLVNGRRPSSFSPGPYYGVPYEYGAYVPEASASVAPMIPAEGWLRFETSPGVAQVYVDGAYVGVVDDFGVSGRTLDLDAGRHHVELRAPDYLTQSFDVSITPSQITRYRGDLQRAMPAAPSAAAAGRTPTKTYIIPNCYAGDRPPVRPLPSGCSLKQMVTR